MPLIESENKKVKKIFKMMVQILRILLKVKKLKLEYLMKNPKMEMVETIEDFGEIFEGPSTVREQE